MLEASNLSVLVLCFDYFIFSGCGIVWEQINCLDENLKTLLYQALIGGDVYSISQTAL